MEREKPHEKAANLVRLAVARLKEPLGEPVADPGERKARRRAPKLRLEKWPQEDLARREADQTRKRKR